MSREYYTDSEWQSKSTRHRRGTTFLSQVRKLAGLTTANCKVRSNKAGPAVGGEAVLHSTALYINLDMDYREGASYARTCKGLTDYHGGTNHTIPKSALLTPAAMVAWLRKAGLL